MIGKLYKRHRARWKEAREIKAVLRQFVESPPPELMRMYSIRLSGESLKGTWREVDGESFYIGRWRLSRKEEGAFEAAYGQDDTGHGGVEVVVEIDRVNGVLEVIEWSVKEFF